jgi:ABC-type branched-subunit amino acid transport system substrate-binding protein
MAQLGLKRFVILHPNDPYGTDLAQLFAREIEQQGGELIYRESYPPQDTDFRDLIRRLKEVDLQRYGTEEEPEVPATQKGNRVSTTPEKIYHPGFDAIFLPGNAQQAGLLAPQLAFYNVVGVTLLGSNGWNSEDLVKVGGRFMEGAIFVDSFFVDQTDPQVKEFVQRYRVRFQQEPDIFSAQAYDSGRMILKALETGANSGRKMRDALSGIRDFPGVSGRTTVNPEGDMEKQLVFLTVRGGKITQLR